MPLKCYDKPNRKHPRVFSARDVGRITAYARQDGANDAELIANILAAFGQKDIGCAVFRILDVLNTAIFLGAIVTILKGVVTFFKGLKIFLTGKKTKIATSILEFIVPERFKHELAAFLLFIGSVETLFGTLIIFLTSIANNVAIYLLAKGVCDTFVQDYPIEVERLDLGDLKDILDTTWTELFDQLKSEEK